MSLNQGSAIGVVSPTKAGGEKKKKIKIQTIPDERHRQVQVLAQMEQITFLCD